MREQYKMVPVEKLKEWEAAINTIALQTAFDIADDIAQYSCAPTVQVEPVSLRQRLFNGWEGCSNHGCVVVDPKPGMMRTNGTCQCVVNASRSQLYLLQGRIQTVLSATQQPTEQQPAPDVEAPSHSLPNWSECNLRVGNSKWLKDNDREPEHDSLTANPLHEFIYEYDDSDAYKSAWFMHRLEKLIDFIRSEQVSTSDVSALAEALELMVATHDEGGWPTATIVTARAALADYRKGEEP